MKLSMRTTTLTAAMSVISTLCWADHVVFEKKKKVKVNIPISRENVTCHESYDDYGRHQISLTVEWNYMPYLWLKRQDPNPVLAWYTPEHPCPDVTSVIEEARLHHGTISRVLSTTLIETIGTDWGGCKRYQDEWTKVQLIPGSPVVISQSDYRIIEELPMARCGY